MNFKKPLSLLLVAGLATAQMNTVAASDSSDAKKAELNAKIQYSNMEREVCTFAAVGFGLPAVTALLALYELKKNGEILLIIAEKAISKNPDHYVACMQEFGITFCKMIFAAGVATFGGASSTLCLLEAYQATNETEEARQKLAELNLPQT